MGALEAVNGTKLWKAGTTAVILAAPPTAVRDDCLKDHNQARFREKRCFKVGARAIHTPYSRHYIWESDIEARGMPSVQLT